MTRRVSGLPLGRTPTGIAAGGSDPMSWRHVRIWPGNGDDEVNLNVGCPSDRVQSGRFGACLMAEPQLVAECVAAMTAATTRPVTVKHRIGIDQRDSYEELGPLRRQCVTGRLHDLHRACTQGLAAGLSPRKTARHRRCSTGGACLKRDFPQYEFVINGGFKTLGQVEHQLETVDGVMIGREAYQNPGYCRRRRQDIRQPRRGAQPPSGGGKHAAIHCRTTCRRHTGAPYHPPHAGTVPGAAWRPRLAPPPVRTRASAGHRCRGRHTGTGPSRLTVYETAGKPGELCLRNQPRDHPSEVRTHAISDSQAGLWRSAHWSRRKQQRRPDTVRRFQRLQDTGSCAQCNLAGADLSGMRLMSADLSGANLRGAKPRKTILFDAKLSGADRAKPPSKKRSSGASTCLRRICAGRPEWRATCATRS